MLGAHGMFRSTGLRSGPRTESARPPGAALRKGRGPVFSPGAVVHPPRNVRTEDFMLQQTLSIIKPDAVSRNLQGEILAMIQKSGLRIVAMKMIRLTRAQAEAFYEVHKERPFYVDLVEYMISGPVVCSVLEGEDAIASYRALMGATNPAAAAEDTIRKLYAQSVQANAVHGSRNRRSGNRLFLQPDGNRRLSHEENRLHRLRQHGRRRAQGACPARL